MKEISGASLKVHSSEMGALGDKKTPMDSCCSLWSIIRSPVYPNSASRSSCNIIMAVVVVGNSLRERTVDGEIARRRQKSFAGRVLN